MSNHNEISSDNADETHNQIIELFCHIVNTYTPRGIKIDPEKIFAEMDADIDPGLKQELTDALSEAQKPSRFHNRRVFEYRDPSFSQCYALMEATFSKDVLDLKHTYMPQLLPLSNPPSLVMYGRFFRLSGSVIYTPEGRFAHFEYHPINVSEHVVSIMSGNYLRMDETRSIGAIGHTATRNKFKMQGHAKGLVTEFEKSLKEMAEELGQKLVVILLEAQKDSRPFWTRLGYRWPENSLYYQPPIQFLENGEPMYDEVPELLMVKILGEPEATTIDKNLLCDAVKTMYKAWYFPKGLSPEASLRAEEYVMKLYHMFELSLEAHEDRVSLAVPTFETQSE